MHLYPNRGNNRKEKPMNPWAKGMWSAVPAAFGVAIGAQAAEPAVGVLSKDTAWTLKTDDTHLELMVRDNKPFITVLKNPAQGWNWTPTPSEVPLLGQVVVGGRPRPMTWSFREASTAADTNGTTLTLRFTSAEPVLELKSVWRARLGVGPVEHQPTIRNDSTGAVAFADADLVAAQLNLVSDQQVRLFPVAGGRLGHGEGNPLPFQMIQVGTAHGVYLAYDYGCGQFASTVTNNQIASRWWAAGIKNTVTATGETFRCPGFMLLTYQGDEDDGANHFRRWFWTYEITRSLYETPTDPPIGTCEYSSETDARPDLYIEWIKKRNYADWGVKLWKTDAWHMKTGHARSAELGEVCRANGLELCMYWNGRRTEEELVAEWNKSKFNYYRTDDYGAGPPFFVNDYRSFMDFNRKVDSLYRKYGIKYENCSNGGNIRTLDVFRRMTWMTHSDHSDLGPFFKNVYAWSYLMCPIQLRSDYNHLFEDVANIRGQLLGSILLSLYNKDKSMSDLANERIKRVFHLYNTRQRAILRGADVYRILPPPADKRWFGIQYYNTFINKGSVLLWQNGGPASQVIKLKGLDRAATYTLTFEDATEKNRSMTGAQLMDDGVDVPMGPNASEIIWMEQRAKGVP